jgi:hypothetical protein
MITCANSPYEGSGMPNHYVRDLLPTGFSRVRTEVLELAIAPAMPPHPVEMHRQLALIAVVLGLLFRHSFLWWSASTLTILAIVLSVTLAALDRLGFK